MKKSLLLIALLFSALSWTHAKHIIGGSADYKIIEIANEMTKVEVTFTVYRDALGGGAQFDAPASFGVYTVQPNGGREVYTVLEISPSNIESLDFGDLLVCDLPFVNVQVGKYVFEVDLLNTSNYEIAYQRCCRDNALNNIKNPSEIGLAISLGISDDGLQSTIPTGQLDDLYPVSVEAGVSKTFDLSIDDDFQKQYFLTPALVAGGVDGVSSGDPTSCTGIVPDPSTCFPPFASVEFLDNDNPYGQNTTITLDKDSGEMFVESNNSSKILVNYTVLRYDENVLISAVNKQFVLFSGVCSTNTTENELASVEMYPNPTTGDVYFSERLQNIQVVDLLGNVVLQNNSNSPLDMISMEGLQSGIYFIKGESATGQKVIKKQLKV